MSKKNIFPAITILFVIVCLWIYTSILNNVYVGEKIAILIAVSPLLLLSLFNFRMSLSLEVLSLFVPFVVAFYVSVYFSVFLFLAFIVTHRELSKTDFQTPFNKYFFYYLISIVPSYIFSQAKFFSIISSFNLLAFFIVFYSSFIYLNKYEDFGIFLRVFLSFVLLNSIYIISQGGISGKRNFGFSGIMFVDYVGIGIVITTVVLVFIHKRYKPIIFFLLSLFTIALILTQTRSIWIVTALCLGGFFLFLIYNSNKLSLNRKKIVFFVVIIFSVFSLFSYYIISSNKEIISRVQTEKITADNLKSGDVNSSLLTRLFIWDTAFNAFKANPVVGIGIYAFPEVSVVYHRIPKILYNKFVKNLTPHETFIAIATERGIIGLIGFLYLLFNMIGFSIKSLKLSITKEQREFSLILLIANIYVLCSMFITDAWLWGHGIVLWSLVLGFTAANRKIIIKQNEYI